MDNYRVNDLLPQLLSIVTFPVDVYGSWFGNKVSGFIELHDTKRPVSRGKVILIYSLGFGFFSFFSGHWSSL